MYPSLQFIQEYGRVQGVAHMRAWSQLYGGQYKRSASEAHLELGAQVLDVVLQLLDLRGSMLAG